MAQHRAPLFETLRSLAQKPHAPFYAPGHKQGQGLDPEFRGFLTTLGDRGDLPELPDLDNLFAPEGVIHEAQTLAAELFGAQRTHFLVNGSSGGLVAALLAIAGEGETVLLPRNSHLSALSGLILSGARPVWLAPEMDPLWDLPGCVAPQTLAQALKEHPEAVGAVMLSPTYQGITGAIAQWSQLTRDHGIPLVVDEAHGAHFAFHEQLPPSALEGGADLVIQSSHKVLGSLTQSSMIHVGHGANLPGDRLTQALQMVQSTSPNYLLLASLDATRRHLATQGHGLMAHTLGLAHRGRQGLATIPGIQVLTPQLRENSGFVGYDRTRLTLDFSALGLTGYDADEILHEQLGVTVELPLWRQGTLMITLGNTPDHIDQLIRAIAHLAQNHRRPSPVAPVAFPPLPETTTVLTPRQVYFAPKKTVPVAAAMGKISGESICPYPPGIPVILAGELITPEAIAYLQGVQALGGTLTGNRDPQLKTLEIVEV